MYEESTGCRGHESIREFIVINLTRSGYAVEQAENGAVALEKFAKDESGFDAGHPGHYDAGGGRSGCVQAATGQILELIALCSAPRHRRWTKSPG